MGHFRCSRSRYFRGSQRFLQFSVCVCPQESHVRGRTNGGCRRDAKCCHIRQVAGWDPKSHPSRSHNQQRLKDSIGYPIGTLVGSYNVTSPLLEGRGGVARPIQGLWMGHLVGHSEALLGRLELCDCRFWWAPAYRGIQ